MTKAAPKEEKKAKKEKPPEITLPKRTNGKKEERLSRKDELELLQTSINKNFSGKGALLRGSEFSNVFTLRRPTGIMKLDIGLGGGFPAGGLSQIIGEDGATKSWLVNQVIKIVQDTYGEDSTVAACMTETMYDKGFAKWKCGIRVSYSEQEIGMLEVANQERGFPPFTPEQIAWLKDEVGVFQQAIFSNAEQLLETAVSLVESNLYQVVLIDSFGALLTAAEAEAKEGLESKHRGGASMVITQFMHRLHAALNLPDKYGRPNTTSVIGINQMRDNVKAGGSMFSNPMNIAGGWALKHGKLVDLLLEKGSKIWVGPENAMYIVGKKIDWSIIKGKAGCHDGPRGQYKFYFGENGYGFGADVFEDLLISAVESSVITKSGSWFSYEGKTLFQGEGKAAGFFMENQDLIPTIRQAIFNKNGVRFITKETF